MRVVRVNFERMVEDARQASDGFADGEDIALFAYLAGMRRSAELARSTFRLDPDYRRIAHLVSQEILNERRTVELAR